MRAARGNFLPAFAGKAAQNVAAVPKDLHMCIYVRNTGCVKSLDSVRELAQE